MLLSLEPMVISFSGVCVVVMVVFSFLSVQSLLIHFVR